MRLRLDIFPVTVPPLRLEGRRENKEDPEAFIEAPEHDIEDNKHNTTKYKTLTEMPVSIRKMEHLKKVLLIRLETSHYWKLRRHFFLLFI